MTYTADADRYNIMKYVRCGNSGLKLPALSLGLWHNFGDVDDYSVSKQMIHKAFDMGITHFDLANNYGPPPGSAEKNFGKMLKDGLNAYRDELIISSKAGWKMWDGPYGDWGSRKYLLASLDQSLKRMGLEYVDIFYSHRPDPETPMEETLGAVAHAVRQGKALYAGISSYDPGQTKKAVEILKDLGTPCLIHQPRYNMFNRWIENGLTDVLTEEGIGCIVFCPLAQGMLTNKYINGIPNDSRAGKEGTFLNRQELTTERIDKIKALNGIAASRGQSLAQMAIAWTLRLPAVTSALIGASNAAQLEENILVLENLDFSEGELVRIEETLVGNL